MEFDGDPSKACITCFAIGAAVWPPVLRCPSTKTAIATCGSSAGAKQMNETVFTPCRPDSAVPVLPATATPGSCAAVDVPAPTAASIPSVTASAVCARHDLADPLRPRRPDRGAAGADDLVDDVAAPSARRRSPIVAATIAICSGVTSSRSCPNAKRPGSTCESFSGSNSLPSW